MRTSQALPWLEITARTGLTPDEVKRFNPALAAGCRRTRTCICRTTCPSFGHDVSFWHRPPTPEYAAALNDFLRLEGGVQRWHEASFETVLRTFQHRFEATGTEEGSVMATTLAYVISDLRTSRRAAILEDFRTSGRILDLFKQGVAELGGDDSRAMTWIVVLVNGGAVPRNCSA